LESAPRARRSVCCLVLRVIRGYVLSSARSAPAAPATASTVGL
jgi:hypothetical protein